MKFMLDRGIILYAAHIPLDAHREVGNNWGFARRLGMLDLEDFAEFKGRPVGVKGRLPDVRDRRELAQMIEAQLGEPVMLLEGGPQEVQTLGIVSGGGGWDGLNAGEEGLDECLSGAP